ncbi:MAG: PPC domain-containing DNA-binding protein [Pseudomonadales bacterium]|jgi:predicted DNA-binding protein with PD1-like motif|nr:PPC domain-containing DNA-binding protein [Pseudomonadales bacterium]
MQRSADAIRILRLHPGADLRRALEQAARRPAAAPAFLLSGIGSLDGARLRPAGAEGTLEVRGDLEILTLAGSLSRQGVHLHASVSDADGRVFGGHVLPGCRVRTTAELVLADLHGQQLARRIDTRTGYRELAIRRRPGRRR